MFRKKTPPSFVMWENKYHIFMVELYKKIINGTEKGVYQYGTYSGFVRFMYDKRFDL